MGRARPSLRDLQGGDDARRARDDPGRALGLGRGVAAARARAAGGLRRGRGRDGHGPAREPAPRCPRSASSAPAAAARVRLRPAARGLRARAPLRPARRGAAHARGGGRPVAPARGRPDPRASLPGGRFRRQAAALRRARPCGCRAARRARARRSRSASPGSRAARSARTFSSRRTCASRNLRACSPDWFERSGRSPSFEDGTARRRGIDATRRSETRSRSTASA